jgi:hypothetical protein
VLRTSPTGRGRMIEALIVGLIILTVARQVPYVVGTVIQFVTFCFGLGAFAWHIYRVWRPPLPA